MRLLAISAALLCQLGSNRCQAEEVDFQILSEDVQNIQVFTEDLEGLDNFLCRKSDFTTDERGYLEDITLRYYIPALGEDISKNEVRLMRCGSFLIFEIERQKIPAGTVRLGGEVVIVIFKKSSGKIELVSHDLISG